MDTLADSAQLSDVSFTPVPGEPGQLHWEASGKYFNLREFAANMGGRFPRGGSLELEMVTSHVRDDGPVLSFRGRVTDRPGAADWLTWDELVVVMNTFSQTIPEKAWLTRLLIVGRQVQAWGFALSQEDIVSFRRNLEAAGVVQVVAEVQPNAKVPDPLLVPARLPFQMKMTVTQHPGAPGASSKGAVGAQGSNPI